MVKKWDYTISSIRLLALIMIITCHIMQYYDFVLAGWFNVGVQIFMVISGYIHATADVSDPVLFFKRKFGKILTDYYLLISIVYVGAFIFCRDSFGLKSIFHSYFLCIDFSEGFITLDHLWFIPNILVCYLLTPLFMWLINDSRRKKGGWIQLGMTFFLVDFFFYKFASFFNGSIICAYLMGMILQNMIKSNKRFLVIPLAIVGNAFQIYQSYYTDGAFMIAHPILWNKVCAYAHVLLGVAIFILLKFVLEKITYGPKCKWLLKECDKYSYDMYLVHNIFILGVFSVLASTNSILLGSFFALILTAVGGIVLRCVAQWLFATKCFK